MDISKLWKYYRVRLHFITNLCASVPANKDLIDTWLKNRQPRVRSPGGKSIDEINEEVLATLAEQTEEQFNMLVFQRNPANGRDLVVRAATLRAHMKDCARVISSHMGKIEGEKSFAVKVKNCVYHDEKEYWIPILRPDLSQITEPDGQHEKPIHVTDARGRPMNALKCFEFIYPARIDFTIKVMFDAIKQQDLETLFMYGGTHGYGGERSDGEGRYTFTINQMEGER